MDSLGYSFCQYHRAWVAKVDATGRKNYFANWGWSTFHTLQSLRSWFRRNVDRNVQKLDYRRCSHFDSHWDIRSGAHLRLRNKNSVACRTSGRRPGLPRPSFEDQSRRMSYDNIHHRVKVVVCLEERSRWLLGGQYVWASARFVRLFAHRNNSLLCDSYHQAVPLESLVSRRQCHFSPDGT